MRRAISAAAKRIEADGVAFYSERQLYYETCRRLVPAHRLPARARCTLPAPLSYEAFRRTRPVLPGLIAPGEAPLLGHPMSEPDLFDYGLARVLVVQDRALAAVLHAHNFPLDAGCPVLNPADLPIDGRVLGMLGRVEGAAVLVLHDADDAFVRRIDAHGLPVTPVGINPAQAAYLHLFRRPDGGVDAAAVRPRQLLRGLYRIVRGVPPPPARPRLRDIGFLSPAGG